jgi:hypothetical protein
MTMNQNQMTARSQVWNQCIPILEAGIEEALTHCNLNYETNMLSNGWQDLYGQYAKTNWVGKSLGLSKEMGYYEVAISKTVALCHYFSRVLPDARKFDLHFSHRQGHNHDQSDIFGVLYCSGKHRYERQ